MLNSAVFLRFAHALLGCMVIVILVVAQGSAEGTAPREKAARISLLLATGMPGGTYYQAGLGLASLWTTRLREIGIRVSAAISEGAVENIEAIRIADADMILVDQWFSSMAYKGIGLYKGHPVTELRSVASLWPEVVHVILRSDARNTGALKDLSGKTIASGLPDSGSKFITELLLGTIGPSSQPPSLRSMSPLAAAEALRNGTVQGLEATGGLPVPVVVSLCEELEQQVAFLSITDAELQSVRNEGWDSASRTVIPAGTYAGQTEPIQTVGQMSILAVAASLDTQVVYALTKVLFENPDYLARVHPACKNIELSKALDGLDLPLHKGAVRYFKERKVKIPERLLQ